jgi:hypothetical protein
VCVLYLSGSYISLKVKENSFHFEVAKKLEFVKKYSSRQLGRMRKDVRVSELSH